MKTILIILLFSTCGLFSQWEEFVNKKGTLIAYKNKIYIITDSLFISGDQGINWNSTKFNYDYLLNEYSYIEGNSDLIILPEYEYIALVSNSNNYSFKKYDFEEFNFRQIKSLAISDYISVTSYIQNIAVLSASSSKLLFSFDDGKNWEYNTYDFYENITGDGQLEYATPTILATHFTETTLFAGGMRALYKLIKHPVTQDSLFFPIYDNIPKDSGKWNIVDIAGNDNALYIILTQGSHVGYPISKLLKSLDMGETWDEINSEMYGINKAKKIYTCGNNLYVIQKDLGVFYSLDQGNTWDKINIYKDGKDIKEFSDPKWLEFGNNFAYISQNFNLYRAPLEDCKIVLGATSVESKEEQEVSVYPNPVKDIIKLNTNTPLRLVLYDIFGNKVLEDTNTQLNVQHLNTGTYYLKYGNETKLIIKY